MRRAIPTYFGGGVREGLTSPEEKTHTAWFDRAHSLDASIRRYSRWLGSAGDLAGWACAADWSMATFLALRPLRISGSS